MDAFYEWLKADGLASKPPREFHGSWTLYFKAPGGFTVEIQHLNAIG